MDIRLINSEGWSKEYSFAKPIVRVGSGTNADIRVSYPGLSPVCIQFSMSLQNRQEITARALDENIRIRRGTNTVSCVKGEAYGILEGDAVLFAEYTLLCTRTDSSVRVQKSEHMEASLILSSNVLHENAPIRGTLVLKNTGTDRPCQFRMEMSGIPESCMNAEPLPFLPAGSTATVYFLLKHGKTIPDPEFQTLTLTLMAPDDYFGETLRFTASLFVSPVVDSEFVLCDDRPAEAPAEIVSEKKTQTSGKGVPDTGETKHRGPSALSGVMDMLFTPAASEPTDRSRTVGPEDKPQAEKSPRREEAPVSAEPAAASEQLPESAAKQKKDRAPKEMAASQNLRVISGQNRKFEGEGKPAADESGAEAQPEEQPEASASEAAPEPEPVLPDEGIRVFTRTETFDEEIEEPNAEENSGKVPVPAAETEGSKPSETSEAGKPGPEENPAPDTPIHVFRKTDGAEFDADNEGDDASKPAEGSQPRVISIKGAADAFD